jgi:LacI family transcriptional regulator
MAKRNGEIVRRVRPRVLVSAGFGDALREIVKLAREWEWDLLDLGFTRGTIPPGPEPAGAFVNCLPDDPLAQRLRKMGCPAVRVGSLPHPQDALLPAVLPDMAATGRLAADHFNERGFKQVGLVGFAPLQPEANFYPAFKAFRERSSELGIACHVHRLEPTTKERELDRYERRTREVGHWLADLPKPMGVLTFNDYEAARICTMCQTVGLVVPEQVALLGYGDSELVCELSPVALSSIDPDMEELGRQAAHLLRRLMNGEAAPPGPIMVPPKGVIARRSTEVLAVPDPVVARAMRFMWDHLDQRHLSVDNVAAEVGVSRRSLERAFRAHLGRGISTELRRRRLERCCELLKTTDMPIVDMVPLLGFRSADYLHTVFRREFGTTPRTWRMANRGGERNTQGPKDPNTQGNPNPEIPKG